MRVWVGTLAVAVMLVSACGNVSRNVGVVAPTPVVTRSVGDALRDALPTDEPTIRPGITPGSGDAAFAITLTDDNDLHPAGIPVKMTGAATRSLTSGSDGVVRGSVPAGVYRFEVVKGCHAAVLVHGGGGARVGLAAGDTTLGNLGVLWQHRYGPSSPVTVDQSSDWPVGETVDVEFTVMDVCSENAAPGKAFPTYTFVTSKNLRLVKPPVKVAGADGKAHVFVSCTAPGDITLDVVDEDNPDDRVDLVALAIGFGGVPRCK